MSRRVIFKSFVQRKCIETLAENPHLWIQNINPDLYDDLYLAIAKSNRMKQQTRCQVQIRVNSAVVRPCGIKKPCGKHDIYRVRCKGKTRLGAQCKNNAYYNSYCCYHDPNHHGNYIRECTVEGCKKRGFALDGIEYVCWDHKPDHEKCSEKTLTGKPCRAKIWGLNGQTCVNHIRVSTYHNKRCKMILPNGKQCPYMIDQSAFDWRWARFTAGIEQFSYCHAHCQQLVRKGKLKQIMIQPHDV